MTIVKALRLFTLVLCARGFIRKTETEHSAEIYVVQDYRKLRLGHHTGASADLRKSWNEFWLGRSQVPIIKIVSYVSRSARTKKIETRILRHFGSFKGLDCIELGSGMGTQSLLLALKGARVTLVDFSEIALQKAKELFNYFGLNAEYYKSDIFGLDSDFFDKFDISMSFGTVEHFFSEPERKKSIDIHYKVIKYGGISFISVPNKICPHYRIFSWLVKIVRRKASEKPFYRHELIRCAKKAGYRWCETFGSSFFEFDYLMPYFYVPIEAQITTPIDDYCAHALTLFAVK
jgi:2-polyprenyl-3-methyl-5-hydroxy-6-metoxy-1,4-benzoquinol methylase